MFNLEPRSLIRMRGARECRYRLTANAFVRSKLILSGLPHVYWLATCN